jgi:hypothetical protein
MAKNEIGVAISEFLKHKRLTPKNMLNTVAKWSSRDFVRFVEQFEHLSQYPTSERRMQNSVYDFVASNSLSGGGWPCSSLDCRLRKADELARFAALYADKIVIYNPLSRYYQNPEYADQSFDDGMRAEVVACLAILHYLRPLLEAGYIQLAPRYDLYCQECLKSVREIGLQVQGAIKKAVKLYSRDITVKFSTYDDNQTAIELDGPDDLFEHVTVFRAGSARIRDLKRRSKTTLIMPYFDDIAYDISKQCTTAIGTYLTTREFDLHVMQSLNSRDTRPVNTAMLSGMSHTVPFLQGAQITKLIKLRQNEGESFNAYRDSLSQAMKLASRSDKESQIRELYNDEVAPELQD